MADLSSWRVRSVGLLALAAALAACSSLLDFDQFDVGALDDAGASAPDGSTGIDGGVGGDGAVAADAADAATDPCLAPNKPLVELSEVATNTTLVCSNDYLLVNQVFVRPGATLTIQAGTTIKGTRLDASQFNRVSVLVVQRGAKIEARGTAERPIVFTSAKPEGEKRAGDWGGVVLLGNAVVNQGSRKIEGVGVAGADIQYGGFNDDDSSGALQFVRIEYGGFKLSANNEINGLTFGGVGRRTVVDHVQVRHVLDDCFEFFGGTVNAAYLACQYPQDDGIDWDFGYRGKLQFVVVQQDPNIYDDSNGVEADNGGNPTEWGQVPLSEGTMYNFTLCGPGRPTVRPPLDAGGASRRTRYGLLLRRHTRAHLFNGIVMGFEAGFDAAEYPDAGGPPPQLGTAEQSLELRNIVFFNNVHAPGDPTANVAFAEIVGGAGVLADDDQGYDEVVAVRGNPELGNRELDPQISGCFDAAAPSFGPAAEIPSGAVVPPAEDDFFIPVGYIGAFKDRSDPWATTGAWVRWTAQ